MTGGGGPITLNGGSMIRCDALSPFLSLDIKLYRDALLGKDQKRYRTMKVEPPPDGRLLLFLLRTLLQLHSGTAVA